MSSIFESAIFKSVSEPYTYNINAQISSNIVVETLGQKIKQLRLFHGLTQLEFGKSIDRAPTTIANFENGYKIPNNSILNNIISIYNLDENYFNI